MKKILILVEGQTEETFVREVLAPHLHGHEKVVISTIVVTKRVKSGPNFKGGVSSYDQVKGDLKRLFRDSSAATITTMLDYYGIPTDFPGYSEIDGPALLKAAHLEKEMGCGYCRAQICSVPVSPRVRGAFVCGPTERFLGLRQRTRY